MKVHERSDSHEEIPGMFDVADHSCHADLRAGGGQANHAYQWGLQVCATGGWTAKITQYTGKAAQLTIATTLDGYSVTSIGDWAFPPFKSLTSITIPDSVTTIGISPFASCSGLKRIIVSADHPTLATIDGVLFEKTTKTLICYPRARTSTTYTIPQGIKVIGASAFTFCVSLTSITIPDSVTSIGDYAFHQCMSLTSITLPSSVTSTGDGTFDSCTSLTNINIPDGVTSIGDSAFANCNALTSITIPNSVTAIGDGAFRYCTSLTSITIPDSVSAIGDRAFFSCNALTSITLPGSVTAIGRSTFCGCRSLTSITVPDSVTSIGDHAFSGCSSLTSITVTRDSYAHQYCIDNGLPYTYPDANNWLLD